MSIANIRLDLSRSHRILWLMEILELDYEVKVYLREPKTWRSPKELKAVHPSGKSPVLEIRYANGAPDKKLVESGYIIQHLLRHYDPQHLLVPEDPEEQENVDYYLHYAEGTLQPLLVSLLINNVATKIAPMGTKTLAKMVTKAINSGYYATEWKMNMDYLESMLQKNGTGYFVGNQLTGADIILSFPVYENVFDNEAEVENFVGSKLNLSKTWPHLYAWSQMISEDPIYIKIDEMMEDLVRKKVDRESKKGRF